MNEHDIDVETKVYEFGMSEYDYEVIAYIKCSCGWKKKVNNLQMERTVAAHMQQVVHDSLGLKFNVRVR